MLGVVKRDEHEDFFTARVVQVLCCSKKIKERSHFDLDCGRHQASIQAGSEGVSFVCFLLVLMGLFS